MMSFVDQLNKSNVSRSRSRNNPLKTSFGQNQAPPIQVKKAKASNRSIAYSEMTEGVSVLDQTVKHDYQYESQAEGYYTPRRHFGATPLQQSFRRGAREESVQRQRESSIQKSVATRNVRDLSSSQNSTLSRNTELNFQNLKNFDSLHNQNPNLKNQNFASPQRTTINVVNQNQSIRQPLLREEIPTRNYVSNTNNSISQSFLNQNSSIISIQAKRRFEEPPKRIQQQSQQEEQSFSRVISHQDSQYIELDFNKPRKRTSFGDSHFEDSEPKMNLDNILDLAANEQQRLDDSLSVISQQDQLRNRVQKSQKLHHASKLIAGRNPERNLSFLTRDQNPMLNSTFADNPDEISLPFLFFDVVKGYFQNLCFSLRRVLLTAGNKIDQQRNLMALGDNIDIDGDDMAYDEITSNIRQNDVLNIVVFLLVCILVVTFYNKY